MPGVSPLATGRGFATVSASPLEVPPPGPGEVTVTVWLAERASIAAGTSAVSAVALMKCVSSATPSSSATERATKRSPSTEMLLFAAPASNVAGSRRVSAGSGFGSMTPKSFALLVSRPSTLTLSFPVEAPTGTWVASRVSDNEVTSAIVPLNRTITREGSFENPRPSISTAVPTTPDVGEKDTISGPTPPPSVPPSRPPSAGAEMGAGAPEHIHARTAASPVASR